MHTRLRLVVVCLLLLTVTLPAQKSALGPGTQVADGVILYRLTDPNLLEPAGMISVQALRLDPRKVTLEIARAAAVNPARETVDAIASRRPGAIAAINAGFFSLETGAPTAFLKVNGEVVSGSGRARGAVGILDRNGVTSLIFDRLLVVNPENGPPQYVPLLDPTSRVWPSVPYAISGAGLLMRDGRELLEWSDENIAATFDTARHPRTIIGTDARGAIWLVTVDGRNPMLSFGMSFAELQRLSKRLGLRSVLNLDGGGSTTMWVKGKVVNFPSDREGPRKVSDAILVVPRKR